MFCILSSDWPSQVSFTTKSELLPQVDRKQEQHTETHTKKNNTKSNTEAACMEVLISPPPRQPWDVSHQLLCKHAIFAADFQMQVYEAGKDLIAIRPKFSNF